MSDLILFFEHGVPVMIGLFILVFASIALIRLILFFLLNKTYKKLELLKNKAKEKFTSKKRLNKEDEELMRVLDSLPKAHSAEKMKRRASQQDAGSYELIASEEQELERKELSEVKIVDIVKPVGFWTSMILGQKLTYLVSAAQIINKRSQRGFWVSMVEAKERAAGKEKGRSL
jgi:hypothetical protein